MKTINFTIKIPEFKKPQARLLTREELRNKAKQVKPGIARRLRSLANILED